MSSFLIFLALVCLISMSSFYNRFHKRKRLPPGPMPWPIFGNLLQLGSLPHIALHNFAKIHGEIMRVKFGLKEVVVASSPKMAEEFLKTQDISFASRPPLASAKYTSYNSTMGFAPYGPHWQLTRKIFQTELLSPKRLDSFEHIRIDERNNFLADLYVRSNKTIVLKEHIKHYTLSLISRVVLGSKYFTTDFSDNPLNMSLKDFDGLLDEWFVLNGVLNIGDWIPFLQEFDLQGYIKRMKLFHEKVDKFLNYVVDDHKARLEENNFFVPKDMVDVLVTLTLEGIDSKSKISPDVVKGLVLELLAGGTDTSSTMVEWAIYELLRHPDAMKSLRDELDRVVTQERWMEEDDYTNMPYLEAIIKETVRLHPLAPLLAPHLARQDCKVKDYDIQEGTIILVNAYSIGRDPSVWDSPNEFKPERFLHGKEISMTGIDFCLLPFGSGRRRCPGYNLGLKIVRTTIGNIIHGFDMKFPEGLKAEDICMIERYGLATCPKIPLSIIMKPRLPTHLFRKAFASAGV